jgi:hypothetical protein
MANQWLKEKFGEKDESSGESRQREENSDERINIGVTNKEKDSVITSPEVAGDPTPATPEDMKYTTRPDTIWPLNVTH